LGGVSVKVGGVAARLVFVSQSQINFIVPSEVAAADLVAVKVNNNGTISSGRIKERMSRLSFHYHRPTA